MAEVKVAIGHAAGLHARTAAEFVRQAAAFRSHITVFAGPRRADGKSILEVLALGAVEGAEIRIQARGEDEEEAVRSLAAYAAGGWPPGGR